MLLRNTLIALLILSASVAMGGVEEWVARYDAYGWDDHVQDLAVDGEGNVYVTGYSRGGGTDWDCVTVKYDSEGDQLWAAHYNGPWNDADFAYALALDAQNNVYVTGYSSGGGNECTTIKYDTDGNQLWVALHGGVGYALAVDDQGNVFVAGVTGGYGTGEDYLTLKYDSEGNEQWMARYTGPGAESDKAKAVVVDNEGSVYVTGYSKGPGINYDYATIRYRADSGEELWVRRYNGPGHGWHKPTGMALYSDGVIVTGHSENTNGKSPSFNIVTIIYSREGDSELLRYDSGHGDDKPLAIAVYEPGCFYIAGRSFKLGSGMDLLTLKYTEDAGQWRYTQDRYDGPVSGDDVGTDVTVDASGNVHVTGYTRWPRRLNDYLTIKYDTDLRRVRMQKHDGPADNRDEAVAIATDAEGNVYVTGHSFAYETFTDYTTIKYPSETIDLEVWAEPLDTVFNAPVDTLFFDLWVCNRSERTFTLWGGVQARANGCQGRYITGIYSHRLGRGFAPSDTFYRRVEMVAEYHGPLDRVGIDILAGTCRRCCSNSTCFEVRIVPPEGTYSGSGEGFEVLDWGFGEESLPVVKGALPNAATLSSNYPNPFNVSTTISYQLLAPGQVRLQVYNLLGERVATLVDGFQEAGYRSAVWNGEDCPSGIYFYKLTVGDYSKTHKMLLLK